MASAALTLQRSFYIGNSLSGILYGIQLIMFLQSIYYLQKSKSNERQQKNVYIIFSILLVILNAIQLSANAIYGQYVWIERGQGTPGGPIAYFNENTTWWVNTFGTSASVAADVMSQALMLYRCYIIMGSVLWVIIFPFLLFLASTALAIVSTIEGALPNKFILSGVPVTFGVPWISISVSFNVLVTAIISLRLMYAHHQMKGVASILHSETYTGVMAIMVESALPLAVIGIIFAVFFGKNSPVSIAFATIWGAIVGVSPQLIILRVAMGIAWTQNTMHDAASSLHFAEPMGSVDIEGATSHRRKLRTKPSQALSNVTLTGSAGMP